MEFKQKGNVYSGEVKRKPVRSKSGVTPLTVVLKPRKCDHGTCIYCPGGDFVPQSYTDKSPAVMRAMALKYDPYNQVTARLNALKAMNHPTDKIELIFLGGTFLQYPLDYQYEFVKKCYDALNGCDSKNLEEAQKINETSEHRCVAFCIENRPDNCSEEEIKRMREFGATRVEIGVQNPDDEIYKKIERGHTVYDVVEATENLKNAGFKVGYHLMPGLPYSSYENDIEKFRMVFEDSRFRPDQLKIYPCQIVEDSPLAMMHEKIGYKPMDESTTKKIVTEIYEMVPEYCRIMRIMREIPSEKVVNAVRLDIRKEVEDKLKKDGIKISEIRMREVGFNQKGGKIKLKVYEYSASNGREFFVQAVDEDDILYGLLRLRLSEISSLPTRPKEVKVENNITKVLPELKDCALIREIHVYGQSLKLGEKGEESQHIGLGKKLMAEAEKIAGEAGYKKIAVISGIGVREYYRKIGYELEGSYMVKRV